MSLTCPDSRLSFLTIQKIRTCGSVSPSSVMSASTCAACDITHSIKASHSRILMVTTARSAFFCRVEEYRREADLAIGSIHGKNQESRHLAWLRYGQHQNVNRSINAFGPARRASPRPPSPRLHSPRPRPEQLFLPRPPSHCLSISLPNLVEESQHKGG